MWWLLSCALVVSLGGSALSSGALLTKERSHIADAPYDKSAVLLLNLELFLICSPRFGGRCTDAIGGFHARRINAICHVISRQSCAGRFCGDISLAVDQCSNGFGMPLFHSPHQCSCAANGLLRIDVSTSGDQQRDGFGIPITRSEHQHGFAGWTFLLRVRSCLQ